MKRTSAVRTWNLRCWVVGHRWRHHELPDGREGSIRVMRCTRCRRIDDRPDVDPRIQGAV